MLPLFPPNDDLCAFLRAIKEAPLDDAPRLIFADYLEENGHPERAHFIRFQCEMAMSNRADRDLRTEFHPKIETLFRANSRTWMGPWVHGVKWGNRWFTRGLNDLCISGSALVETMKANPDQRHFAWVERLRLLHVGHPKATALPDYLVKIPDLRDLSFLETYSFDNTLRFVWASRAMNSVEYLEVTSAGQATETLRFMVQSPQWHRLRTLHLRQVYFDDALGQLLANPTTLPPLQTLRCSNCYGTPTARAALRQRFGDAVWEAINDENEDDIPF